MKRLILILAILASVVAMCAGCAAMAKGVVSHDLHAIINDVLIIPCGAK